MIIDSKWQLGSKLETYDVNIIKNEPMFFNSNYDFAYENGGEPTKQFLKQLLLDNPDINKDDIVIDSRVHMLMDGWFPCIPGYHHDDVDRDSTDSRVKKGQPNYYTPDYRAKHCFILYGGDICPTEFALGKTEFTEPTHDIIYKEWHKEVCEKLNNNELLLEKAPADTMIYFDDRTWHQGTKAVKSGWRLLIRATWDSNRKPTNEIRRQVQVYLENPMEGW